MRTKMTLAATCLACFCIMGCHDSKQAAAQSKPAAQVMASNEVCPLSGHAINPKFTSTYNGKTIGFCCGGCKAKFDAMSDADKAKMAAK
ncbi:MAG TPA: hypothetical protein VHC70_07775 [Phycisphaerales bacterium]|jgi:hypothetical protein|nr:hypothetical protein [Phycisphaerales bacterium]